MDVQSSQKTLAQRLPHCSALPQGNTLRSILFLYLHFLEYHSNFKTALVSGPAFELSASLSSCWLSEPPLQGSRCRWSGPEPVASRRRPGSGPENKQVFFKKHLFLSCFGPRTRNRLRNGPWLATRIGFTRQKN